MDLQRFIDVLEIKLADCYFIYMGDDNKDYPVMDMLKSQRVFNASTFVCRDPILEEDEIFHSTQTWQRLMRAKNKEYVLIFADLKIIDYFLELLKLCRQIDYPNDKIIVITTNDDDIFFGTLGKKYNEFCESNYVMGMFLVEDEQELHKSLEKVLFRQPVNYDTPTIQTFFDELEWEFVWKYCNE